MLKTPLLFLSNGVILYTSTENVTENVTNQVPDKSVYRLGKRFSGRTAYYILGGCTMKRKLVSLMLVVSMTAAMVAGCGSDDKKAVQQCSRNRENR